MISNTHELSDNYSKAGFVLIEESQGLFSEEEFSEIEEICQDVDKELVEIGDADEPTHLEVGRFLTDVEKVEQVNRPLSDNLLNIIFSAERMEFYKEVLQEPILHVRRAQFNSMGRGGFIGRHLDVDSNPDYIVAIIIQFGEDYGGGEFVIYPDGQDPTVYKTRRFSTAISNCHLEHEVKPITHGTRGSLVYFLSKHDGKNPRHSK